MHGVLIDFSLGISQNQSFLQHPSTTLAQPQLTARVTICQSISSAQATTSTWESGRSLRVAAFTRGTVIMTGLHSRLWLMLGFWSSEGLRMRCWYLCSFSISS